MLLCGPLWVLCGSLRYLVIPAGTAGMLCLHSDGVVVYEFVAFNFFS